jgi:hypothetical protein
MKKQDALFQLIKSLTRGEKRNFHILAQLTAGDKKYLQLFDVIDNLEEYDELKILKKFKHDEKFEKQFAYNKNYLYNSILNSLAYFHKGIDAEYSSIILHVRILLEKNLYFQAKKLLNKAKESVLSRERFEELLRLLSVEVEIIKSTENIKLLPDMIREIEFAERLAIEKIANLVGYQRLERQTFILQQARHVARKEDDLQEVSSLLAHPLLQDESQALSIRARIFYNEVHRRLGFYKGEHDVASKYASRVIELYDAAPAILEEDKLVYHKQIVYAAHHKLWTEGYDVVMPLLEKIKSVKINTPQERISRFDKYYLYSMGLRVTMADEVSPEYLKEFTEEVETLENDLAVATRLNAAYITAHYYMVMEEYSKALVWINKFLNHPRTNLRTDLQSCMRLMNLLTHFELGNYDLIEYNLKSTYRFIYKQERMHQYERRFIRFFRDAIALTDRNELPALMRAFREEILEIVKDPFEARASDFYSILAWLEAKLEGGPVRAAKRREVDRIFGNFKENVAVAKKADGSQA